MVDVVLILSERDRDRMVLNFGLYPSKVVRIFLRSHPIWVRFHLSFCSLLFSPNEKNQNARTSLFFSKSNDSRRFTVNFPPRTRLQLLRPSSSSSFFLSSLYVYPRSSHVRLGPSLASACALRTSDPTKVRARIVLPDHWANLLETTTYESITPFIKERWKTLTGSVCGLETASSTNAIGKATSRFTNGENNLLPT